MGIGAPEQIESSSARRSARQMGSKLRNIVDNLNIIPSLFHPTWNPRDCIIAKKEAGVLTRWRLRMVGWGQSKIYHLRPGRLNVKCKSWPELIPEQQPSWKINCLPGKMNRENCIDKY